MLCRRILTVVAAFACTALMGDSLGTLARAQTPLASDGPVDPAMIEDLVAANRILADQGVLDGSGMSASGIRTIPIASCCHARWLPR